LAVDDDCAVLVPKLVEPAGEFLNGDADSAVDMARRELLGAADIEKRCTLRDEVTRIAPRDSYRGETHVEHGPNDDDQDD